MDVKHAARQAIESTQARAEEVAGGPARLRIILLLAAVLGMDTADKAAVSAVAGSLKEAFKIGNTELGMLIAAVSLVGAIFTLPIGVLVDRINRRRILVAALVLWTVAMVVSGTVTSFVYLLLVRIFLGAVTAAAAPTVASLVGDFFPVAARARAYGMILAGEFVGIGVGFIISGEISSLIDWRWAFFLMGVPSIAVAWAIWRYLPEPARGGQGWIREGQEEVAAATEQPAERKPPEQENGGAERSGESEQAHERIRASGAEPRQQLVLHQDPTGWNLWHAIRYMLQIPTYRLLVIASSLGYYFFSGARAFAMIYFTAHYGLSRGAMSALMIVVGIGALAGVMSGGRLSGWLMARGWVDARIVLPGAALFVATLLAIPAIWTTNAFVGIALLTCATAALAAANPPLDAARLDVMYPRLWGRAEAGRTALRAALEAVAPLIFGWLSGVLGSGNTGLERTFLLMLVALLAASSLAIPARRSYPRDVATADESIKQVPSAQRSS